MNKWAWLCGALLLIFISGIKCTFAQTIDEVSSAVVYLERKEILKQNIEGEMCEVWIKKLTEQNPQPYYKRFAGTAIFVSKDAALFMVTAEHIARQMNSDAIIIIRDEGSKPYTLTLQELWNKSESISWIFHDEADVAILQLHPNSQIIAKLKKHFLSLESLQKEIVAPEREKALSMVGFPLGLGVKEYFSPLSKEVKTSSGLLRLRRFDNRKEATFFLLSDPSVGGYSGAPIFELPGTYTKGQSLVFSSSFRCWGLVHGTISDETGGKFAAITPAAFIVQLIQRELKKE